MKPSKINIKQKDKINRKEREPLFRGNLIMLMMMKLTEPWKVLQGLATIFLFTKQP